jgi:hypothetical protein
MSHHPQFYRRVRYETICLDIAGIVRISLDDNEAARVVNAHILKRVKVDINLVAVFNLVGTDDIIDNHASTSKG